MPSATHDALVALFRNRPALAPELLRDALHVELAFIEPWPTDTSYKRIRPDKLEELFLIVDFARERAV